MIDRLNLLHILPLRSYYLWHRRVGIGVAVLVILLAVTGIALNHTRELGLDQRFVQSPLLLDWYGIRAPQDMLSYAVDGHWISRLGERLYLDERELPLHSQQLQGAVKLPEMLVLAVDGDLLLLTGTGELIERLGAVNGVPPGLQGIAVDHGQLVVLTAGGTFIGDETLFSWQRAEGLAVAAARPAPPPEALREALARLYRGHDLHLERVILDLHSGRFWGAWGVWAMDAAALLMLFLAISGSWIWWRRHRRR